ncbi:MAG: LemA family protein [Planctomycetota bacterium]|jgi:LemA protein
MSRIGAIVRRLYAEELKPAVNANNGVGNTNERSSRKKRKLVALKQRLGNQRTVVWGIRIAVILVVLFIAAESVFQFNRLTSWDVVVTARRADLDRELQRRENLIPNLVFAVSKYVAYEQGVFRYVSDAREALKTIRSSETPRTQVSNMLEQTLSRLVALAEEYPDLKATQSVQDLIREAANTEDRIADAKEKYNEACEVYNQYRTIFPGNVFAFIYRFKELPFIGVEEALKVPVIDLKITEGAAGAEEDIKVPVIGPEIAEVGGDIEKDIEVLTKNLSKTEGAKE